MKRWLMAGALRLFGFFTGGRDTVALKPRHVVAAIAVITSAVLAWVSYLEFVVR